MLIIFSCKSYADITMFGDIGLQMLTMMGQSGTVPGAILATDVPEALVKLKAAIEMARTTKPTVAKNDEFDDNFDDVDTHPPISIVNRALPLIKLLTAAAKNECDVMWDTKDKGLNAEIL